MVRAQSKNVERLDLAPAPSPEPFLAHPLPSDPSQRFPGLTTNSRAIRAVFSVSTLMTTPFTATAFTVCNDGSTASQVRIWHTDTGPEHGLFVTTQR